MLAVYSCYNARKKKNNACVSGMSSNRFGGTSGNSYINHQYNKTKYHGDSLRVGQRRGRR